jgi:site-specific recombinase XerD
MIKLHLSNAENDIPDCAPIGASMSFIPTNWVIVETGIYKHRAKAKAYYVVARLGKSVKKRECTVFGTLADARVKYAELVAALKSRSLTKPEHLKNIKKALAFYIHRHYSKKKQYRIASGKTIMRYWMHRIGELHPSDLQAYHINKAIREMQEAGYKESGIVPYVSRLRTALEYTREQGKISYNRDLWGEAVKLKPQAPRKLIFDAAALEPIYKQMPNYAMRVIRYKEAIPCRLLELYEARADEIDLSNRTFKIRRDKNGNERLMPIPSGMVEEFEEAIACGSEWVFYRTERRGEELYHLPLSRGHLSVLWRKAATAAGVDDKIKLRMLRHLAISEARANKIDDRIIEELAGANRQTMSTYYDMVKLSEKLAAADKLAQIVGRQGDASGKIVAFVRRSEVASD